MRMRITGENKLRKGNILSNSKSFRSTAFIFFLFRMKKIKYSLFELFHFAFLLNISFL